MSLVSGPVGSMGERSTELLERLSPPRQGVGAPRALALYANDAGSIPVGRLSLMRLGTAA